MQDLNTETPVIPIKKISLLFKGANSIFMGVLICSLRVPKFFNCNIVTKEQDLYVRHQNIFSVYHYEEEDIF